MLESVHTHSPELRAALEAAEAAARILRSLYQRNVRVELKADRSPVTEADVKAEQAIRSVLAERFPEHGFYGEESGRHRAEADALWLVDPLDGTKSFIRDTPFFSTQIALLRGGHLVLGVSSAPLFGEIAWAEAGAGAYLNGQSVRVSDIAELAEAIVSTGNLKTLARSSRGWQRLGELIGRVGRIRGYGDFVHYHLLARGSLDVVIESDVNILDIAALAVIVREAGGKFTDLEGKPVGLETTSVLAANGRLHQTVLASLSS
jgi:histidinol-phosphatase